ncbi:MAG: CPBP family intramembrane glutamic endopeptidase [Lachnospiraceae bacterium]
MMKKAFSKDERVKIIVFILIAFVLPNMMGIMIKEESVAENFALFMMILPTFGVIAGRIVVQKKVRGWLQWLYLLAFIFSTIVMGGCMAGFMSGDTGNKVLQIVSVLSVVLFLASFIEEQELFPFRNFKSVIGIYFLFLVVNQINYIPAIMKNGIDAVGLLYGSLLVPVSVFVTEGIFFFGEEYAWRRCIMGKLQNLFGKRMGVIALGIIWEVWHAPLWISLYGADQQVVDVKLFITIRLLHTIGFAIFMGWAYMKTNNIWICILLHGLNNTSAIGYDPTVVSQNIEILDIATAIFGSIVFMLFLFTKEYRSNNKVKEII